MASNSYAFVEGYNPRGRRRKRKLESIGFMRLFTLTLLGISYLQAVYAVPVAQAADGTTSSTVVTAIPSPTVTLATSTSASSTSSGSSSSTTTTADIGTVVTDSPLVRTKSLSSQSALPSGSRNQSALSGTATDSSSTSASTSIETKTLLPSPTSNDDGPSTTQQEQTYNSLLNFYFLILAGAFAFAILGWWYWRRRRKGKTSRDQRRGLEALRRDLELGRLRRGFLGVVGRGGSPSSEELPTYQSVRTPPPAVLKPPGYEETVRTRTSSEPLQTIEEEQSNVSRPDTPDNRSQPLPPPQPQPPNG